MVPAHDLWWERFNIGSSKVWLTAYRFTFEGSHVRAKDVLGSQDVCLGDGTVGQLIGGYDDVDELFGARPTNLDL